MPSTPALKVRIGFGLGTQTNSVENSSFRDLVDALESGGWDSLWLSEQLSGSAPDPLLALSWAAARTRRLKFGTAVTVVPGRNPVVLAKQMASLDRLSSGRFLPAVGLGAVRQVEQAAFGIERSQRAPWFDEALALMRRLWTEDDVTHKGERFAVEHLTLGTKPSRMPFEVWLGGRAPSELRRVGRVGDGWLPSFCTAEDVEKGWLLVNSTAEEHGRRIDPQHLGVLVPYSKDQLPEAFRSAIAERRPDVSVEDVIPVGLTALRAQLEGFIEVGASKFVVVPVVEPQQSEEWNDVLSELSEALFDLQT